MANRWLLSVALLLVGLSAVRADEVDRCRKTEGKLMQRVYQVADLVIPIEGCPQPACKNPAPVQVAERSPLVAAFKTGVNPHQTTVDQLIALIKSTVSPKSWAEAGGNGTIDYFALTMALVINQTTDIQEQVADLLEALRRLQDVQIILEVRLISVGEGVWDRLGLELEKTKVEPQAGTPVTVSHLNDKQVCMLMEALQQDRRTCVMTAPKMTMFNGQQATVNVMEQQTFATGVDIRWNGEGFTTTTIKEAIPLGFKMTVQPVAAANHRSVKLCLNACMTKLQGEPIVVPVFPPVDETGKFGCCPPMLQIPKVATVMRVDHTLDVPVGTTALLSNNWKRVREARTECGPPVVSKIPGLNRLFRNVGYGRETEEVVLMVTPRIVVQKEKEAKLEPIGIGAVSGAVMKDQVMPAAYSSPPPPPVVTQPVRQSLPLTPPPTQAPVPPPPPPPLPTASEAKADVVMKKKVVKILAKYEKACAEGRLDEAKVLATKALAIDPTCFRKER